jgi:hypothetical protein
MRHKHQDLSNTNAYNFPGLKQEVRRNAVNDNHIPLLGTILKHTALMTAAFALLFTLKVVLL